MQEQTIARVFELKSLEEAYKLCSSDAVAATKDTPKVEAIKPTGIQTSLLLVEKLPELLNIKDERSEEEILDNVKPYKYKDIEVKYVHFLNPNQLKFIAKNKVVVLEFLSDEHKELK